jgi:hypothetical protein
MKSYWLATKKSAIKYDRHAKKKQKVLGDVDIFLANKKSAYNTRIRHAPTTKVAEEWTELDYWDSGEAIKLFNPTLGKSVKKGVSVTETNCCRTLLRMQTWLRQ